MYVFFFIELRIPLPKEKPKDHLTQINFLKSMQEMSSNNQNSKSSKNPELNCLAYSPAEKRMPKDQFVIK